MADWGSVIEVVETKKLGRRGDVETWFRYTVQTKGGIQFSKDIPELQATPAELEKVLGARARELDKTKAL